MKHGLLKVTWLFEKHFPLQEAYIGSILLRCLFKVFLKYGIAYKIIQSYNKIYLGTEIKRFL